MNDGDASKNEADQRTFIVLGLLLGVAALLLALVAIVLPQVLGIVLVIGGMGFFATAHYVVWGWWLPRYLNRKSDPNDD